MANELKPAEAAGTQQRKLSDAAQRDGTHDAEKKYYQDGPVNYRFYFPRNFEGKDMKGLLKLGPNGEQNLDEQWPMLKYKLTSVRAWFEDGEPTVYEGNEKENLSIIMPVFRAEATLELGPLLSGEAAWQIGWITACSRYDVYTHYALCSDHQPFNLQGKLFSEIPNKFISCSDAQHAPWHNADSCRHVLANTADIQHLEVRLHGESEKHVPDIKWVRNLDKKDMQPYMTNVTEEYFSWLVLRNLNTLSFFVIKTIVWQRDFKVTMEPQNKVGKRIASTTKLNKHYEMSHIHPLPEIALQSPFWKEALTVRWYPEKTLDETISPRSSVKAAVPVPGKSPLRDPIATSNRAASTPITIQRGKDADTSQPTSPTPKIPGPDNSKASPGQKQEKMDAAPAGGKDAPKSPAAATPSATAHSASAPPAAVAARASAAPTAAAPSPAAPAAVPIPAAVPATGTPTTATSATMTPAAGAAAVGTPSTTEGHTSEGFAHPHGPVVTMPDKSHHVTDVEMTKTWWQQSDTEKRTTEDHFTHKISFTQTQVQVRAVDRVAGYEAAYNVVVQERSEETERPAHNGADSKSRLMIRELSEDKVVIDRTKDDEMTTSKKEKTPPPAVQPAAPSAPSTVQASPSAAKSPVPAPATAAAAKSPSPAPVAPAPAPVVPAPVVPVAPPVAPPAVPVVPVSPRTVPAICAAPASPKPSPQKCLHPEGRLSCKHQHGCCTERCTPAQHCE